MELLDFNFISERAERTQVTYNTQKILDLAFANFPSNLEINEHVITDHYGVEVDFKNSLLENREKAEFNKVMENCNIKNSKLNSNGS